MERVLESHACSSALDRSIVRISGWKRTLQRTKMHVDTAGDVARSATAPPCEKPPARTPLGFGRRCEATTIERARTRIFALSRGFSQHDRGQLGETGNSRPSIRVSRTTHTHCRWGHSDHAGDPPSLSLSLCVRRGSLRRRRCSRGPLPRPDDSIRVSISVTTVRFQQDSNVGRVPTRSERVSRGFPDRARPCPRARPSQPFSKSQRDFLNVPGAADGLQLGDGGVRLPHDGVVSLFGDARIFFKKRRDHLLLGAQDALSSISLDGPVSDFGRDPSRVLTSRAKSKWSAPVKRRRELSGSIPSWTPALRRRDRPHQPRPAHGFVSLFVSLLAPPRAPPSLSESLRELDFCL